MKRFTLTELTGLILIVCMLVLFASGMFVMQSLQASNLELLYANTQQLVRQALEGTEQRVTAAKQTAYDIIVSDTTQSAVSGYWDAADSGAGRAALNAWTDGITNSIAANIYVNGDVLCANYIDAQGTVRVVASRNYIKLTDSQAAYLSARAVAETGGTVLVRGDEAGMSGSTLIVLKQLREKRRLSMRHTGVVALFLDMNELGSGLTSVWDGSFELRGEGINCVLGTGPAVEYETAAFSEGYELREYGGVQYFVLKLPGRLFDSCVAALPYNPMFATSNQLLGRHTVVYAVCCAAVLALALILMVFATKDFGRLRKHLSSVSEGNDGIIPALTARARSRDADGLYESFNGMAERINRLIRDNYAAKLEIKDAQLAALQAQINPHFLYNTLNSIYWAAKSGGNEQAAAMTQDLSMLLRDAVNSEESVVSVDRELEITCSYIRIQKQRYRERLNVEFDIDTEVSGLAIPKFTIQPLIENAIKYGIEPSLEGGRIDVKMESAGGRCVCLVTNGGPAPDENLSERIREGNVKGKGSGVGLVNIDRRIRTMFGDDCGVTIYRDEKADRTVTRLEFAAVPLDRMQENQL